MGRSSCVKSDPAKASRQSGNLQDWFISLLKRSGYVDFVESYQKGQRDVKLKE